MPPKATLPENLGSAQLRAMDAVRILATSDGGLAGRLGSAFTGGIGLIWKDDVPEAERPLLTSITQRLTSKRPKFEHQTPLQATLIGMRVKTAMEIAADVWELHRRLERYELP